MFKGIGKSIVSGCEAVGRFVKRNVGKAAVVTAAVAPVATGSHAMADSGSYTDPSWAAGLDTTMQGALASVGTHQGTALAAGLAITIGFMIFAIIKRSGKVASK